MTDKSQKTSPRAAALQAIFTKEVGALLAETQANTGYKVSYQPAWEADGVVRLNLQVVHRLRSASFMAEIESRKEDSFTIRCGNETAHMSAALLAQSMGRIRHGILSLRPNA